MLLKNLFKKATKKVEAKKPVKKTSLMDKCADILSEFIDGAEVVNSTAANGGLCLYIYVAPSANIEFVEGIYAEVGIKVKKHTSHLDGKKREVLYISFKDISEKLSPDQQKFLERTAPTSGDYNRKMVYTYKKCRLY